MSFQKCKYKYSCRHYDPDSICCTFLNKKCVYGNHFDKMEEIKLENIRFSLKGIEGIFSKGDLFELSQQNKDTQFKEDYY